MKNEKACCAVCYKVVMGIHFGSSTVGCLQDATKECALCSENILEDHILCDNKVFHPRCMKCQVCDEQLRGKYLIYKDWPICEKDFRVSGWLVEQ